MKTLYLDCGMGAAGDMLTGALLELISDREGFLDELNAIGIPGVHVTREDMTKCGILGSHMHVLVHGEEEGEEHHHHDGAFEGEIAASTALQSPGNDVQIHKHHHDHGHGHHHSHTGLHGIEHTVRDHLRLPEEVKADVLAVYHLLAEAESRVHGVPMEEIHFHEVGSMDALADITAVCLLMHRLAPDEVIASPVHVGSGCVRCAHGILPVPAPATALLLEGIPSYSGEIRGELCTPTGAALLKHFVTSFGSMPVMKAEKIGYGMGRKDFERLNAVRAISGERAGETDSVIKLECNLDDMTAEALGFASEQLYAQGALEVYYTPVTMKKSRPGTLLTLLCRKADRERLVETLFRHTTTIGIRESEHNRYTLTRRVEVFNSPCGEIRKKISSGYGVTREKWEYEDLARIAREKGCSLKEALNWVMRNVE